MNFIASIGGVFSQVGIDMLVYFVVYNVIVCTIYGIDKRMARIKGQRVSERTLKLLAVFFGGLGACVGMIAFHHKTRHTDFKILVPLCLIVQLFLIIAMMFF